MGKNKNTNNKNVKDDAEASMEVDDDTDNVNNNGGENNNTSTQDKQQEGEAVVVKPAPNIKDLAALSRHFFNKPAEASAFITFKNEGMKEAWNNLSEAEKQPYWDQQAADDANFATQQKAYNKAKDSGKYTVEQLENLKPKRGASAYLHFVNSQRDWNSLTEEQQQVYLKQAETILQTWQQKKQVLENKVGGTLRDFAQYIDLPPKKPMQAPMLFFNEKREATTRELNAPKVTDVGKAMGKKWNELSDAERAVYKKQAEVEKEKYYTEVKKYTATWGKVAKVAKFLKKVAALNKQVEQKQREKRLRIAQRDKERVQAKKQKERALAVKDKERAQAKKEKERQKKLEAREQAVAKKQIAKQKAIEKKDKEKAKKELAKLKAKTLKLKAKIKGKSGTTKSLKRKITAVANDDDDVDDDVENNEEDDVQDDDENNSEADDDNAASEDDNNNSDEEDDEDNVDEEDEEETAPPKKKAKTAAVTTNKATIAGKAKNTGTAVTKLTKAVAKSKEKKAAIKSNVPLGKISKKSSASSKLTTTSNVVKKAKLLGGGAKKAVAV